MKPVYKKLRLAVLGAGLLSMVGLSFAQQGSPPGPPRFRLKSPVVRNNGGVLPVKYTCDGEGISPPLYWENPPDDTRSYAILMLHIPPGDEAEHVYMVVYNIPADVNALPEGSTDIGVWGQHSMRGRETGYTPPCSGGGGLRIYTATIYALNVPEISIDAPPGRATMAQLKAEIRGRVMDSTYLDVVIQRGSNAPDAAAGGMGGMAGMAGMGGG